MSTGRNADRPGSGSETPCCRTPDGRYLVVRGRLWRASNPGLPEPERQRLVTELMAARRNLRGQAPAATRAEARAAVQAAKVALGERGPVWWTDDAPDLNRHLVRTTPYAEWYASVPTGDTGSTCGES